MKRFKVVFLILGSIIGAGATSGIDIFSSFAKYGSVSLFAVLPMFFLIYFALYALLQFGSKNNSKSITTLNLKIFKKNNKIINAFTFLAYLLVASAMFSSISVVLGLTKFSFAYFACNAVVFLICIFISYKDITFLKKLNVVLTPVILISLFILLIVNTTKTSLNIIGISKFSYLLPTTAVLYVFRDMFLSYFVIIQSASNLNKKDCRVISLMCAIIISVIIYLGIYIQVKNPQIQSSMPYLDLAKNVSTVFYFIFQAVILIATFTTMFSTLFTFKGFIKTKHKLLKNLLPSICMLLLAQIGFDVFIEYLYPIIGIMGLYLMFCILPFKPFFKVGNNGIHYASQKAKYNSTSHNKV